MTFDNQIKYRCKRGSLELDLILNDFFKKKGQFLSYDMKKLFLDFLELDDNYIWNILNSTKYSKKYDLLVKLIYPIN